MEYIRPTDGNDKACFVFQNDNKKLNVPGVQHCRERSSLPYMRGGRHRALIGWPVFRVGPCETAIRSVECTEGETEGGECEYRHSDK